jgi:hypothetical protein
VGTAHESIGKAVSCGPDAVRGRGCAVLAGRQVDRVPVRRVGSFGDRPPAVSKARRAHADFDNRRDAGALSRDGSELFYIAPDGRLMAVPMWIASHGAVPQSTTPIPLFATRILEGLLDLRPLGNVVVKGKTQPVPIYEVQGRKPLHAWSRPEPAPCAVQRAARPVTRMAAWSERRETASRKTRDASKPASQPARANFEEAACRQTVSRAMVTTSR